MFAYRLCICVVADIFFLASQGPVGEYYEAGELGGTDTGGAEGGQEIRAMRVCQNLKGRRFSLCSLHSEVRDTWILVMTKSL